MASSPVPLRGRRILDKRMFEEGEANCMTTILEKPIKRELALNGALYTVTISTDGVKIVPKGKRTGHEISWETLLAGDAELRRDLNISLDAYRGA